MDRTVELLRKLGWRVLDVCPSRVTLDVTWLAARRDAARLRRTLENHGCVIWPAHANRGRPHMWIEFDPTIDSARLYLVINDEVLFGPQPEGEE
jgi:hypothetical protein